MITRDKLKQLLPHLLGLAIMVAVGWCYWPVLVMLVDVIGKNEDFWFGLLLPPVSGFLVYRLWPQIRQQAGRPSWLGLAVVALGFGLYIFGEFFGSLSLPAVSLMVVLAGLIYVVGGPRLVSTVSFPLFLLVLMIPYEGPLLGQLTLQLQLISTRLAAWMLELWGMPVFVQGNIIDLGTQQLNVVAACSGLRYLINLLILGLIFCYFFQRRLWKAGVLLLSMIPYAILGNAMRLATIGIFPIFKEGWWHSSIGLSIFIVGFDYLKLINWVLNYLAPVAPKAAVPEGAPEAEPAPSPEPAASPGAAPGWRVSPYLAGALVVVVLGGSLVHWVPQATAVPLIQSLDKFPLEVGPWVGTRSYIQDPGVLKTLQPDNYLDVTYVNPNHGSVSLWIVHYGTLIRGKFIHAPAKCIQGVGGIIKESGLLTNDPDYPVNYFVFQEAGVKYLVYYWMLIQGRWQTRDYDNRLPKLFDGLKRQRLDGVLVRLSTPITDDPAAAQGRLASFMDFLKGELPKFIRF